MNRIVKWFKSWDDGVGPEDWLDVLEENMAKEFQKHEEKLVEDEGERIVKLYMGEPLRKL